MGVQPKMVAPRYAAIMHCNVSIKKIYNQRCSKIFKPKTFKQKTFKDIETTWRNAFDTVSPSMFPATQLYTPGEGRVLLRCSLEQLKKKLATL